MLQGDGGEIGRWLCHCLVASRPRGSWWIGRVECQKMVSGGAGSVVSS